MASKWSQGLGCWRQAIIGCAFRESGIKGKAIHTLYIEMTYGTMDKDGNIKSLPPLADINVCTLQHTFMHLKRLLFTTQFSQIALVVTSRTAFEDMHSKGLVQPGAAFAGHSLPISCQISLLLTSCFSRSDYAPPCGVWWTGPLELCHVCCLLKCSKGKDGR